MARTPTRVQQLEADLEQLRGRLTAAEERAAKAVEDSERHAAAARRWEVEAATAKAELARPRLHPVTGETPLPAGEEGR